MIWIIVSLIVLTFVIALAVGLHGTDAGDMFMTGVVGFLLVAGIGFFLYIWWDFASDKKALCDSGQVSACIEYNRLINANRR